ncbi:YitT family protein [Hathewaya histolytica]|uniref:Transporter protein n=1 Tax=Hathewaya histolytica TaxID=1498 RepID=A0A4U9RZK0_HATHI|nr:YitT family protein [Hathewaya histolytica]VTQ94630.1 transporter protein [Hathewaya histolytica]
MNKSNLNKTCYDYILIMIGVSIAAFGVNQFLVPANLVIGGLAGLAIVIEHITKATIGYGVPLWMSNIIINIPLFAISIKQRGLKFGTKSMFAAMYFSVALWYTEFIPRVLINENLFLSSIYGAISLGAGVGLVLRASATTGGSDMAASIIQYKFESLTIAKIMMFIDSTIILMGAIVFGVERAMYALVSVYVVSKVVSTIVEGVNFAKAVLIISNKSTEISESVASKLKRGSTYIKGRGMYTKVEKDMLFIVVSQKQIVSLRKIVKDIDPKAFITVSDVREALGEGFMKL